MIRGDFTKLNIPAGDQDAQFDSVENTPDGAVLYLADDENASSWVVSLFLQWTKPDDG